jgi:hypothetical protein
MDMTSKTAADIKDFLDSFALKHVYGTYDKLVRDFQIIGAGGNRPVPKFRVF